jgi:dephospho-CoA kinase
MSIQRAAEYTNSSLIKPIIIGIAGTLSSGKDTIAKYLEENKGFLHPSTSDMLRAEKKRVFGDSPEALLVRNDPYANKLRIERGAGFLIEMAYAEFLSSNRPGLVISGIRAIGEVEKLREIGGKFIFVDADPKKRYERAQSRARDIQDKMSFDDFMAQEASESDGIDQTDKNVQNLPAMKRMADVVLYNNEELDAFLVAASKAIFSN